MLIKSYKDVSPTSYQAVPEGVQVRETEGKDTPFKPGDSVYIAPNEQHCFLADSATPVQMICCIPSQDQCRL